MIRIRKDAARQVRGRTADARKALRTLRGELKDGSYVPTRTRRFDTYLREGFLPGKRPGLMPKTYGGYVSIVETRLVPALARYPLQDLDQERIQKWIDGMWAEGLKPKTIREYYNLVRAALKRAVIAGILPKNTAEGVEFSRARRTDRSRIRSVTRKRSARSTALWTSPVSERRRRSASSRRRPIPKRR